MTTDELIALFRRMADEHWSYRWGAADRGCVDCSGAFVWAGRQSDIAFPHGSNAIARRCVETLLPVSAAAPGMAVFRIRTPGSARWSLPRSYAKHPDQNDYYHIGLVDADGQHVLHAKSSKAGFVREKFSGWSCCGVLLDVKDSAALTAYTVAVPAGETLNVRAAASKHARRIGRLPADTAVTADAAENGWAHLRTPVRGWVMQTYLRTKEESA